MVQQANLPKNRDILTRIQDQDDLVEALRSDADGQVLTADDAEYDEARTPYFPVRIGKPVAVVRPKHADDVAIVVDAARRRVCRCSSAAERTTPQLTARATVCSSTSAR